MPKAILRDPRKIIHRLQAEGWELRRVTGSHHVFNHRSRRGLIIVPRHPGDLKTGTARSIAKAAGWLE